MNELFAPPWSASIRRRSLIAKSLIALGGYSAATLIAGCSEDRDSSIASPPLDTAAEADQILQAQLSRELKTSAHSAYLRGPWNSGAINALIDTMGSDALKRTGYTIGLSAFDIGSAPSESDLRSLIANTIADLTRWKSIPGTADSPLKLNYHDKILLPTARLMEIPASDISGDTFVLESAIVKKSIDLQWQAFTRDQRLAMLKDSGWTEFGLDAHTISNLSAGALPFRIATANAAWSQGFRFYSGVTSGICRVGQSLGIKLPFSLYSGVSSAIKTATSPFGIVATSLMGTYRVLKWLYDQEVNSEKLRLALVLHIHNYRASSLTEAGYPLPA
jgi:hypothetical protein